MKKIMFSDQYDLTQAVLEGRKTMTRRALPKLVQELLDAYTKGVCVVPESAIPVGMSIEEFAEQFAKYPGKVIITHKDEQATFTPSQEEILEKILEHSTYKVGEVVAIAQRYTDIEWRNNPYCEIPDLSFNGQLAKSKGWKNKMYVRADLMPHRIRITNVRIERIQDISDEDCMREGVRKLESDGCPIMFTFDGWSFKNKVNRCTDSPKEAFEALFKKLSGKKAWDDNPWVFVYEFELGKVIQL